MPKSTTRAGAPLVRAATPSRQTDPRSLVQRILDTPDLSQAVPRLAPELLHQVIQRCGLETCGELLALATPAQLERVADLDLWRSAKPGLDEQFDASRFEVWLEALLECGAGVAARTLTAFDATLVSAGLAPHVSVFDVAAVSPYVTTDGEQIAVRREFGTEVALEIAGYRIVGRRADVSWDAIVEVLQALAGEHGDYFHRVIRGCRTLSSGERELDGLDDLLGDSGQTLYDLASGREARRESRGFLAPPEARAFLQASRKVRLDAKSAPALDPIAHAYFRLASETAASAETSDAAPLTADPGGASSADDGATAVALLTGVLAESGLLTGAPRMLLDAPGALRLGRIHAHLQRVLESDAVAHAGHIAELGYLANALMAGCSILSRPFTAPEAWDAAVAVCNLGLENWPNQWRLGQARGTDPVDRDLVTAFQVGWTVLYDEVCLRAAGELIEVLNGVRVADRETQTGLNTLRRQLTRQVRVGTPWQAREAMDVLSMLDMPAWAALLGLLDQCPVIHAALGASLASSPGSIPPDAFEFVSENAQIASVHAFLRSLPATLRP